MRFRYHLPFWIVIVLKVLNADANSFQRVCYLNASPKHPVIHPGEMRWGLCTHLIFAFATLANSTIFADPYLTRYITDMINANQPPQPVKYLVSVGSTSFDIVKNETQVNTFIESTIYFMQKYNLDGLDIDWEFPNSPSDKQDFSNFLQMLRIRFDKESKISQKTYILTVALSPIIYIVNQGYSIPSIAKSVDFVNLMTYDFHVAPSFPYTNHNSPLYPNQYDLLYLKYFNINFAANYIHSLGMAKKQILIGFPFYGYLYYLSNPKFHNIYALSNGTQVPLIFKEICNKFINLHGTSRVFDHESKVPYAYNGKQWLTYDDAESVTIKAQWIADNGFGGSMTFALNYDDYNSQCKLGKYLLQQVIYDILN